MLLTCLNNPGRPGVHTALFSGPCCTPQGLMVNLDKAECRLGQNGPSSPGPGLARLTAISDSHGQPMESTPSQLYAV